MISDLLSIAAALGLSFLFISVASHAFGVQFVTFPDLFVERFAPWAMASAFVIFSFYVKGHYHSRIPYWQEAKSVASTAFFALLLETFAIYSSKADVSRLSTFTTWLIAPVMIMWVRSLVRDQMNRTDKFKVLIIGNSDSRHRAKSVLKSDPHFEGASFSEAEFREFESIRVSLNSPDVVLAAISCNDEGELSVIRSLKRFNYNVYILPPALGFSHGMRADYIIGKDAMLIGSNVVIGDKFTKWAKRLFDISISFILLILLLIPMAVVMAIISLDGGSPIFRHERVGRGGQKFKCFKLRSMAVNGDKILEDFFTRNPDAKVVWDQDRKIENDPRITLFGRFIRKTSIDEIPQLLNVIRGEMSLVGPRPVTESELQKYEEFVEHYLAVKPGITGLWQVSGRSDLTYGERVELDSWYVENWSPWHDLAILFKTFSVVFGGKGAY